MGTEANDKYFEDIIGNDEITQRYGRNLSALILPPLIWEEVAAGTIYQSIQDIRRGIRIEGDPNDVFSVTIKQIDDSEITVKLRPLIDYPWFIKGLIQVGTGVDKVWLAK